MKEINYFDTPMQRRERGNLATDIINALVPPERIQETELDLADESLQEEVVQESKVEGLPEK